MSRISRETVVPLVIGLVIVAGIGMTAGALPFAAQANATDDPQPQQEEQQRDGGPPGSNLGSGNVSGNGTSESNFGSVSRCVKPLASTSGTMLVALGFLGLVGVIFHRYNFSAALLVGWTALPPIALVYFLMTNCAASGSIGPDSGGGPSVPGEGLALDVTLNLPPWALLSVVGLVLVAAAALMYRSMGEEDIVAPEEDLEEEPDLDEFAEAAGRAADNIEEHAVDVDNAVYQAWVEMTDLIEVDDPDVYSAGEFAATAIDLGMDEDDVTELTRLFNEVRYGDRDAAAREDGALAVLRNIEQSYGGAESDSKASSQGEGTDESTDGRGDE